MQPIDVHITYNTKYWTDLLENYLSNFAPDFLDNINQFPERIAKVKHRVESAETLFTKNLAGNLPLDVNLEQCTHQLLHEFEYPLYARVKDFVERYHSAYYRELVETEQLREQLVVICQQIRQRFAPDELSKKTVTDALIDQMIISVV